MYIPPFHSSRITNTYKVKAQLFVPKEIIRKKNIHICIANIFYAPCSLLVFIILNKKKVMTRQ